MKDPRVYLAHILEAIQRIESYIAAGQEAFFDQKMVQDAVIRNFEIIGEATKRLPSEFRQAHPDIPWRGMASLRDVLIHDYAGVDLNEVWRVIENELPRVKEAVVGVLPPLDQLEAELAGDAESTEPPDAAP